MVEKNYSFRCIAYQEKDGSFTGVCLDLDIVEEGHKSLQETVLSVNEAISSHIQTAAKLGFPKELMYRPAPKEYWDKVQEITKPKNLRHTNSPFRFYTTETHESELVYA